MSSHQHPGYHLRVAADRKRCLARLRRSPLIASVAYLSSVSGFAVSARGTTALGEEWAYRERDGYWLTVCERVACARSLLTRQQLKRLTDTTPTPYDVAVWIIPAMIKAMQ